MIESFTRSLQSGLAYLLARHQQFNDWLSHYRWLKQCVRTNEIYFGGVLAYEILALVFPTLHLISWTICWRVGLILNVYLITQRIIQLQAGDK